MSHEDTNTSTYAQKTLSEAKKERKQYEQDAALLNNRIKLLKLEEEKTWKHIEETKRKTAALESARKQNLEKLKIKEEARRVQEEKDEENRRKAQELRFQIEAGMKNKKTTIEVHRKKARNEIQMLRQENCMQLHRNNLEIAAENKKRSTSVKVEHIKQSIRAKKSEKTRQDQAKAEYLRKVNEEFKLKSQLESKVSEMETLESELIRRLQNTQSIQEKVNLDLENMKRSRYN